MSLLAISTRVSSPSGLPFLSLIGVYSAKKKISKFLSKLKTFSFYTNQGKVFAVRDFEWSIKRKTYSGKQPREIKECVQVYSKPCQETIA